MGDPHPAGSIPVHLRQNYFHPPPYQMLCKTASPASILNNMKKLILLIIVVALVAFAVKKVRSV